jgi:SAM-dependent methyltransferase
MKKYNNPSDIMELANQFRASRVFLTAFELGIFSILGDEGKTSSETASILKTNPRATDRIMNALAVIGIIEKKEGSFYNTPAAAKFLVKGKPGYMGGLGHTVNLWDSWTNMTEAVIKGSAPEVRKPVNDRGENWVDSFIAAMHMRAKKQGPVIISKLDLSGVSKVLDLGGGPGTFSFAFIDAKEGLKATVFDLPNVVPLTHKYIEQEGYSGKVDTLEGDYLENDIGSGYDLTFLSAVIHSNSPDDIKLLFSKCYKALNKNGQIVVLDYIMNDDRTEPAMGAMFALNMLVNTDAGDTYTESEVRNWMEDAGFSSIKKVNTEFGTDLIIGRKS